MINRNIALIAPLSRTTGLGHFMRLKILQKKLNLKNYIWIMQGNRGFINKFKTKKDRFNLINTINGKNIYSILKKNNCGKIIMDLSSEKNLRQDKVLKLQNYLLKKGVKIISFDIPKQKKIVSNISIFPFYFNKNINKSVKSKIYRGYDFVFLEKIKRNILKKKSNEIKKILIVVSGSDPLNLSYRIFKLIKDLPYEFRVIMGENYNNKIEKFTNSLTKVSFLNYSKNIYDEIVKSDAVICGEGTIKFIPILMQKPTIIIHQFDNESEMIKDIIKKNIILSLGKLNNKNKFKIIYKIKNYLLNKNEINKNIKNMKKYFNLDSMSIKQNLLIRAINLL